MDAWAPFRRRSVLPAVRCRRASVSCEYMAIAACRYNTAFASRCAAMLVGPGRDGTIENVFPLQLVERGGDGAAIAVFPRAGAAQEKILGEFTGAVWAGARRGGVASGGWSGGDLDTRSVGGRSAGGVSAGAAAAGKLSQASDIRFHHHGHRAGSGARADEVHRRRILFSIRLDVVRAESGAGDPAIDRADFGNRDMAEFSAGAAAEECSGGVCERADF